ncbi:hypothetical protein SHV42_07740 [Pseudomonas capeferrum]|uniref:hypothetical protein n=1 Tax=Pseudomonas capeferrum TaxID=1495066 RepID=UPI00397CE82A
MDKPRAIAKFERIRAVPLHLSFINTHFLGDFLICRQGIHWFYASYLSPGIL